MFSCVEEKNLPGLELCLSSHDQMIKFRDVRDNYGNTLLIACVAQGWKTGVKFFTKNKFDVNASNKYENTCLHFAVESGEKKICDYLCRKGGDKTKLNEMGLHPFQRITGYVALV